jgi:hypothetical protein
MTFFFFTKTPTSCSLYLPDNIIFGDRFLGQGPTDTEEQCSSGNCKGISGQICLQLKSVEVSCPPLELDIILNIMFSQNFHRLNYGASVQANTRK